MRIFLAILFLSGACWAAGGTCPAGANYRNPSSPTGALVTLSSLGLTSCYFVADNGSDSNNGTTEGTPFLHAPFMPNCSGNCATVTSQSAGTWQGEAVIFRGGDVWHFGITSDSAGNPASGGTWLWNTGTTPSGSASNPIYLGADPTWFSGGSFARPKFDADNGLCGLGNTPGGCTSTTDTFGQPEYYVASCAHQIGSTNNFLDISAQRYYIIDNFEMTGLCQSAVGQPAGHDSYIRDGSICNTACSSGIPLVIENMYIHGASHLQFAGLNGSGACTAGVVCFNITAINGGVINSPGFGDTVIFNVVDFSDSDPAGEGLNLGGFFNVSYNVFRYTSQLLPGIHTFHDNLYEYFFENGHSNMIESNDQSTTNAIYNNIFRHVETFVSSGGGVLLWAGPASGSTDYIFNNLAYDVGNLEYINNGGTGLTVIQGNYVYFNNTWQANGSLVIFRDCPAYTNGTMLDTNDHYITDSASQYLEPTSGCSGTNNITKLTNLLMSNATATSDGYTSSQTFAYSPATGGSPTVGAGTNRNSAYCGALTTAGLTDAAIKCLQSTGYACSYAGNGAAPVCPALVATARPSSTAWDQGAYEYPLAGAPGAGADVVSGAIMKGAVLR